MSLLEFVTTSALYVACICVFFVKFFYKTFFCLFVCFWYTVRSLFGSINCDSLFTGIWASESSVVKSAQREEGLLQPEAAQQN